VAQEKYSPDYFSIEHIIPQAKGGSDHADNLAYACLACNSHKYTHTAAIDPVSGIEAPLFNPRIDNWDHHFQWTEDFSRIAGLTPTGRATIEKLHLNRTSLVNLRIILAESEKHPPEE
jgi:hypothetical protein